MFSLNLETISQGGSFVPWIALIGGFLTALTPCVYPLIPIHLGILGARNSPSKRKAFLLSLAFVIGLSIVYSSLGYLVASSGKILGSQLSSRWFLLLVVGLFLTMGLSLLGLFEISFPSWLTTSIAKRSYSGYLGSFVFGALSGFLAAPCSGPVVVGILAYVAKQSNPLHGFFLLWLFSLGLGFPFLLLGTFSHLIAKIPRSGVWTEWIEHLCGLALIAAAMIYLKNLLPVWAHLSLLSIGAILLVLFMKKVFPLSERFEMAHITL